MPRPVLLVAHRRDEHARALALVLQARGREVQQLSEEDLPRKPFAWTSGGSLRLAGITLVPGTAAMWRRPSTPVIGGISPAYADFAASESRDAFEGALDSLDARWLTPPEQVMRAERKLYQLHVATRLGIRTPETIVTNSPSAARTFLKGVGHGIAKPVRYGLVDPLTPRVAWTTAVGPDDVRGLTGPPVVFQRRIDSATHLRVVTVRSRSFVAELQSDELDWRRAPKNHDSFARSSDRTFNDVRTRAVELAEALGLGYSSQDWIVDRSADAWFLEANPSGQWLFLDREFDGEITSELADALEVLAA